MEDPSREIRQWLASPAAYSDAPDEVEICETHISWVFLAGRHALKLKKPVKFDFLDFSTSELRQQACEEELRLNLRLAPDVYLKVVPILRRPDGTFAWDGEGETVDWVVWMRRLRADIAMDQLIREGSLTLQQEESVADYLAAFYRDLPPSPVDPHTYCQGIEQHVRDNLAALLAGLAEQAGIIRKLHTLQLRTLALERAEFDRRVAGGRVVEGHGDLRPEHIYLEDPPAIIDCIEFSREFRTIDVADELGFLDMESRRLGNTSLGPRLLAAWKAVSGDEIPPRLYAFYGSYRACVRGKVAMLRQQQLAERGGDVDLSGVIEYLHLAEQLAQPLGPPSLVIVGGLSGSGKSTLARQLAEHLGQEVLSTDTIRQETRGPSTTPAGYAQGHYQPQQRAQIYEELARRAEGELRQGVSLIVDGTFLRREQRQRMFDIAREQEAVALFTWCQCDRETAVARIKKRAAEGTSDSEARVDIYDQQTRDVEPSMPEEPHVAIDTTRPLKEQVASVFAALRHRLLE